LSIPSLPQPGDFVQVRQQRYVVEEVVLNPTSDPSNEVDKHLVRLISLEDDAIGEKLSIVWELEPGLERDLLATMPKPTRFDLPQQLDAFLTAMRWGIVSNMNGSILQAPFRSGVEFEVYQLAPLLLAMSMSRTNLLIADDVGLGKTIEAGLIAQELLLRYRINSILIVCPALLVGHWQEKMLEKFGLEFKAADRELLDSIRRRRGAAVNPWTHYPYLITSLDFVKQRRPLELLKQAGGPQNSRRFSLLIVDEVHNAVSSSPTGRSKRQAAIQPLATQFEHKLFLSATPHNGFRESFARLLHMLDAERFPSVFDYEPQMLREVMVRRLKRDIKKNGKPAFPERRLLTIELDYTNLEREAYGWLQEYTRLRRKRVSGQGVEQRERFATEFVMKLLKKRMFSSPQAFALTLAQHRKSLDAEQEAAETPSQSLRQISKQLEQGDLDDKQAQTHSEQAVAAAGHLFGRLDPRETALLDKLTRWAKQASREADSKAKQLIAWLEREVEREGRWDRRVIIFTEYRDTQDWLSRLLHDAGLADEGRLELLHGGMDADKRNQILAAFQTDPSVEGAEVRILLATDAAAEGLDLQRHCSHLIHYEIPWNPNRMEQRNGRIDRHGQTAEHVEIYHFVSRGYQDGNPDSELDADLEFLSRVAHKVENIRTDLGSVGAVLASQVERAMLGEGARVLDDAATQRREREAERAINEGENARQQRDRDRNLRRDIEDSRTQLDLTPAKLRHVVETAMKLAGQPALIPVDAHGTYFRLPAKLGKGWAAAYNGLLHPHTHKPRLLTFDQRVALGRDDVLWVHLNHPLARVATSLLRAEVSSPLNRRLLQRVTARFVSPRTLPDPLLVAHLRLVLNGGDNFRIHEEVLDVAGYIVGPHFDGLASGDYERVALPAMRDATALPRAADAATQADLIAQWPQHERQLQEYLDQQVAARIAQLTAEATAEANQRLAGIASSQQQRQQALNQQLQKEQKQLAALERKKQKLENKADRQLQMPLLGELDPQQSILHDKSVDELAAKVAEAEARVELLEDSLRQSKELHEAQAQEATTRFANYQHYVFPIAITYLIPDR